SLFFLPNIQSYEREDTPGLKCSLVTDIVVWNTPWFSDNRQKCAGFRHNLLIVNILHKKISPAISEIPAAVFHSFYIKIKMLRSSDRSRNIFQMPSPGACEGSFQRKVKGYKSSKNNI
ncbi:MAG: hypothetical protein D6714_02135, partial [Bacteroidetes bacterium]